MDIQYYGANCVVLTVKGTRIVIDDNLAALGGKSITKAGDIVLYTAASHDKPVADAKIIIDSPGEYEISDISITGIPARAHLDEGGHNITMYKVATSDTTALVTGHIYPELSDKQLEEIGLIDVMFVPVGGHGFTVDPIGALKISKAIEPKLIVPTHFAEKGLAFEVPQTDLKSALHDLAMDPIEITTKLRVKPTEMSDVTQLVVLERS